MYFGINWNEGYEVGVTMVTEQGGIAYKPLRNFGDRQGDAKIFKEHDCPRLSELHIRMLIKNYKPSVKYIRLSERRFVKQ